jgi:copper homeostasis protein CutC
LEIWNKTFGNQIAIMPGSGINSSNCSRFKEAGFKALHFSGSMALESITIPKEVNESMSFLHQEILESNPTNLKNIIQRLKD